VVRRKCRKITFITDSRFGGTRKKLVKLSSRLKKSGVKIVREGTIRTLRFPAEEYKGAKPSKSYRKSFVIDRYPGEIWNDVYKKVNKIQAPYYKPVNC